MYQGDYQKKLTTPARAVGYIAHGSTLVHGMGTGEPPALLEGHRGGLSGPGTFMISRSSPCSPWSISGAPCWRLTSVTASRRIAGLSAAPTVNWCMVGGITSCPTNSMTFSRLIRDFMKVDVTVTTVSPMDKAGFFSFGTVNDYISTSARYGKKLLVEVNRHMPRVFGEALLHVSEVDAIVENDQPLLEVVPVQPKPEAEAIGHIIAEMVPDGATIQLGIGGIPNALCLHLENHRDLGIHTELFCPGMMHLIKKGVINGRRKNLLPYKHIFTNALGDREMYEFMNDNPSMASYPVSYTNDPHVISQNDHMISVNSTIEVDILGQCNSEYLGGFEYSGTGGQLDYVRGAFNSLGGKSIIAFYATAHNGEVSRVVPRFNPGTAVTTPRMDTHFLVTEYGAVNLKGKSTRERALDVISLAHPRFRDDLLKEAQNLCLL